MPSSRSQLFKRLVDGARDVKIAGPALLSL